jgi:lysozyme
MRWTRMPWPAKASAAYLFADVSSNNPSFNAVQYASAGHLLIAIKATQGATYVNPSYGRWCVDAHRCRLAVAHYHFVDGVDPVAEAQHFWAETRPHYVAKTDRLVVDIEDPALQKLGRDAPGWLHSFDRELHRLSGVWAEGYTFKDALTPDLRLTSGKWWVASYGNQWPSGARRALPNGSLWAWQYADGGPAGPAGPRGAAGIGACDMSVLSPPIVTLLRKSLKR